MTKFTEGRHPGEFLLSEANFHRSRDSVTIAESQTIDPGTILQKKAVVDDVVATASVGAGNTGNATIAMDATATTSKVKDGRYKGIAVTATTVRWEDPDGKEIGTSTHGALFAKGGIRVTITAGGVANVAGDEFYVDVAADAGDFQHSAYDPDSDAPISGVALYPAVTGSGETVDISAITRDAEVKGPCLAWPDGATNEQKADAVQALAALGIIVR